MIGILAEKPDQGRKYAKPFPHKDHGKYIMIEPCSIFPKGACIVWAIGHLCELKPPEMYREEWAEWKIETLPMIPEKFEHIVVEEKAAHFNIVKRKLQEVDEIIIATDPAREGELIARLILKIANVSKKPLKRLWCSSLEEDAIKQAFQNLRDAKETEPFYFEALARSFSDWLVGLNTSRAYSILFRKKFGIRNVFSSGRVQTPILCLIRQREEERENFKPQKFYQVAGWFQADMQYGGLFLENEDTKIFDYIRAKEIYETCKTAKTATVKSIVSEEKKNNPPKLHSLSTLQAKMNRKYKLSPERVLEIAQKLYQDGKISYPRTSSQYLTEAEAQQIPYILEKLSLLEPYTALIKNKAKDSILSEKGYVNAKKVEDHYALIPTKSIPDLDSLSKEEQYIYDEIVRSTVAVHYPAFRFTETTIITGIQGYDFISQGRQTLDKGWKIVWKGEAAEEEEKKVQKLPVVSEGQQLKVNKVTFHKDETKPPALYSEGQLITLMKTAGRFVEDPELETNFGGVGTEATRSGIIKVLKDREYILVKNNKVYVTDKGKMLIEVVKGTSLASVEMTAKWENLLTQIGKSGDKAATMSRMFINKSKELTTHLVNKAIKDCETWSLDSLAESVKSHTIGSIGKCPCCGKDVVERDKFYGCNGYKAGCKFSIPKEFLGKTISNANAQKLLEKGKSNLIKGFKSKKETEFEAYLKINGEHKLEFIFPEKKSTSKSKVKKGYAAT